MGAGMPTPSTDLLPASRLPDPGCPDCLYLVDLSGYVFRAYHAIAPLSSSKGEPTHAVLGTVNMLQKVVNEHRPAMLAVAMDSKGPTFRHELDVRYKANRPPPPADLSMQMARCEAIVRAYNIPTYQVDGLEADDLIASVVARALGAGLRVVIVSSDKDLMQLVRDDDDRVVLWDSMRDKVYGPAEVHAKFGVAPSKLRDLLALTGDTSDNIPGVPSVGPKTASDLLDAYGSIDGIYERIGEIKRAKLKEALTTHEADARVSQKLVSLNSDVAIDLDLKKLPYGGANEEELRGLFTELEFNRLLDLAQAERAGEAGARMRHGQRGVRGPRREGAGARGDGDRGGVIEPRSDARRRHRRLDRDHDRRRVLRADHAPVPRLPAPARLGGRRAGARAASRGPEGEEGRARPEDDRSPLSPLRAPPRRPDLRHAPRRAISSIPRRRARSRSSPGARSGSS